MKLWLFGSLILITTGWFVQSVSPCSTDAVTEVRADERKRYIEFQGGAATSSTKNCYHWRISTDEAATGSDDVKLRLRLLWVVIYGNGCGLGGSCLIIYDGYNDSLALRYVEMRKDSYNITDPLYIATPNNPYVYIKFYPGTQSTLGSFRLSFNTEDIDHDGVSKKTAYLVLGVIGAVIMLSVLIGCTVCCCKHEFRLVERKMFNPYTTDNAHASRGGGSC